MMSRLDRQRIKRNRFNNEMIKKEKYMVHGFVREIPKKRNVPVDIVNVIVEFAHHEFHHLKIDGQWNRQALQKQILQDCIVAGSSWEMKNSEYLKRLNETDVKVIPGSHSIIISLNSSDYGLTANRSRKVQSYKHYAMNERDKIILSCPAVPHDYEDIFCVANRFHQFITLKEQDSKLINAKNNKSIGVYGRKSKTLPFFRSIKCSNGRTKYSRRAFKSATFQNMFCKALREINTKR
eukprot:461209_1